MSTKEQVHSSLRDHIDNRAQLRHPCWTCLLPEREEIDSALNSEEANAGDIASWLFNDKGYNRLTQSAIYQRVRRHVVNGHLDPQ